MDRFSVFFSLGLRHIADLDAYDHMLFILALVAIYRIGDIKTILILVTAFTLGHSLTLILATFEVLKVNTALIEFLIPVTIFLTAAVNIAKGKASASRTLAFPFLMAVFFGLIHGLGFSNYLRMMLIQEKESITLPLLAFNLGIEVGQLLIVAIILIISTISSSLLRFKHRDYVLVISAACAGASLVLMKETIFW